ncbi:MAG: transposase [Candidatus Riflebacteria bacterium]|nr:transposase [Candidatus Riflebacteria bacterium]
MITLIFSLKTGYDDFDDRIKKTFEKKENLLMVLEHSEIPLHNNSAENSARDRVRKRDVSYGPRTENGAESWDTFMSIAGTAKKLGVSFFKYIFDRISKAYKQPSLAEMISIKSKEIFQN